MKILILLSLFVSLTAGCALTTDVVDVQYASMTASNAVPGADQVTVQVNATEGRVSNLDRVSVKKNGYGMEMAPIVSSQPIPELVKAAVAQELAKMGFKVGPGNVIVTVEVNKFFNDFKVGFFSGDAISEVTLNVQVRSNAGQILFARAVSGENGVGGVMINGGSNAKLSLDKAFSASIARLVSDPNFTQAMLDANTFVTPCNARTGVALR